MHLNIELITIIRSYGPFVHETTASIHIAYDIDLKTVLLRIDKATKS